MSMGPKYFGKVAWGAAVDCPEDMVPTPVGALCLYCGEPIQEGDHGVIAWHIGEGGCANRRVQHRECFLRSVFGSVAHIERRCSCYAPGAREDDPPGMTKREAALAACRAAGVKLL